MVSGVPPQADSGVRFLVAGPWSLATGQKREATSQNADTRLLGRGRCTRQRPDT